MSKDINKQSTSDETRVFAYVALLIAVLSIGIFPIFLLLNPDRVDRLTTSVSLHAVTISLWFVLFGVQPWLSVRRKTSIHRVLGQASALIVIITVITGLYVSISIAREFKHADAVFIINSFEMVGFVPLYVLAIRSAKHGAFEAHKRYMLFATLFLTAPPVDRLSRVMELDPIWGLYGFFGFLLLTPVLVDFLVRKKLHSTTVGCLIFSSVVLAGLYACLNLPDLRAVFGTLHGRNF